MKKRLRKKLFKRDLKKLIKRVFEMSIQTIASPERALEAAIDAYVDLYMKYNPGPNLSSFVRAPRVTGNRIDLSIPVYSVSFVSEEPLHYYSYCSQCKRWLDHGECAKYKIERGQWFEASSCGDFEPRDGQRVISRTLGEWMNSYREIPR